MMRTAGELLVDLVDQHPEKQSEIITFCGINAVTFKAWLKGTSPRGLRQTKLFLYLIQHGLKPSELRYTSQDILRVMALLAAEDISPSDALRALGSQSGSEQQVWKYIRANNVPLASSLDRLRKWLSEEDELTAITREVRADKLLEAQSPETLNPPEDEPDLVVRVSTHDGQSIAANLAALLAAAYPLAVRLESNEFTDDDRQHFRNAIGEDQFFALSNSLTRLSGVQARSMTRPTQA